MDRHILRTFYTMVSPKEDSAGNIVMVMFRRVTVVPFAQQPVATKA